MQLKADSYPDMNLHAALIGGVAFPSDDYEDQISIETSFGNVDVRILKIAGHNVALIPRHANGGGHIPPHMINYRANICAVHRLGISNIISTNSVGTMKNHPVGSFFLPDDFIDFTRNRPLTFFDEKTVHVDVTEPYCPRIRSILRSVFEEQNIGYSEGVYVCTEGPRFETKAEIRMMQQFGDVVGMTGLPELVLAKEQNMCYASICTVTNDACGLGNGKMTVSEVLDILEITNKKLQSVITDLLKLLPYQDTCECSFASSDAEL